MPPMRRGTFPRQGDRLEAWRQEWEVERVCQLTVIENWLQKALKRSLKDTLDDRSFRTYELYR